MVLCSCVIMPIRTRKTDAGRGSGRSVPREPDARSRGTEAIGTTSAGVLPVGFEGRDATCQALRHRQVTHVDRRIKASVKDPHAALLCSRQ